MKYMKDKGKHNQEVLYIVEFLKMKSARERMEPSLTSESSLRKDWLLAEEEEAWKSL
jgi:hypothetical protein